MFYILFSIFVIEILSFLGLSEHMEHTLDKTKLAQDLKAILVKNIFLRLNQVSKLIVRDLDLVQERL